MAWDDKPAVRLRHFVRHSLAKSVYLVLGFFWLLIVMALMWLFFAVCIW